jgi:DNA polymerase-1
MAVVPYNNQELKDLGFKMLIPIHDEILAECPKENAKRCGELMEQMMIDAAKDLIVPISCDAEYTEQWYGKSIEI